jgi:hypothetical protein
MHKNTPTVDKTMEAGENKAAVMSNGLESI